MLFLALVVATAFAQTWEIQTLQDNCASGQRVTYFEANLISTTCTGSVCTCSGGRCRTVTCQSNLPTTPSYIIAITTYSDSANCTNAGDITRITGGATGCYRGLIGSVRRSCTSNDVTTTVFLSDDCTGSSASTTNNIVGCANVGSDSYSTRCVGAAMIASVIVLLLAILL